MYQNPNKKNYLTNVLLFARRCNKFGFWPCSFAEFSMIPCTSSTGRKPFQSMRYIYLVDQRGFLLVEEVHLPHQPEGNPFGQPGREGPFFLFFQKLKKKLQFYS
jgi:hypothetical protein